MQTSSSVLALLVAAVALGGACTSDGSCVRNSDCPSGVCTLGACFIPVADAGSVDDVQAADALTVDAGSADTSADSGEDASEADADAMTAEDASDDATDADADATDAALDGPSTD